MPADLQEKKETETSDETNKEPYLNFKTEQDLTNFLLEHDNNYLKEIESLKQENLDFKKKNLEIKVLNDKLNIFHKSILEKYEVKNFTIDKDLLDYTSFENFEKSVLRAFEKANINYKKTESKSDSKTEDLPKFYI